MSLARSTRKHKPKERQHSLTPDEGNSNAYYQIALALLEQKGFLSLNKLAKAIGCSYYTVRRWWQNIPEFKALYKDARQMAVDEVKDYAFERAQGLDGKPGSDLMTIYILNNFDEEIVERMNKNRGAEITIHLDVPSAPQSVEGWSQSVLELPPAEYKELEVPAV